MGSKEIRIKNREGKKLFCRVDGIISKRRSPSVLIVHGFSGNSSERHIAAISDSLAAEGFLTLRVDLTKNPGKSYLDFSEITYAQELSDLEDVLEYFLQMPDADPTRIGIAGHSLGGMLVAELTAKRKEIKSAVLLSAVYDPRIMLDRVFKKPASEFKADFEKRGWTKRWSQTLNKNLKIRLKFYTDIAGRTAGNFVQNITHPTLIIASGSDESVSQEHADNYLKFITSRNKKMEIIEGADHIYSGPALDKVVRLVADWFVETL